MTLTDSLPDHELQLARLTSAKLAQIMHGLMSVGTAALELDSPLEFLAGRQQTPLGFLEVLGSIGVKPGHIDKVELLRERVRELSTLTKDFHRHFLELANWRSMPPQAIRTTVDQLGDRYTQFCLRLGEFCTLLGMDVDFRGQAQQDRSNLNALVQTIAAA